MDDSIFGCQDIGQVDIEATRKTREATVEKSEVFFTLSDQLVFLNPRSCKEQQLFDSTEADSFVDGHFGD